MAEIKGADLLAKSLKEQGVQFMFGVVGFPVGPLAEAAVEAVRLFARTEGVSLDPIYTGKAAAGMISDIRAGRYGKEDTLVFVHTGGTPAIFTWSSLWV